jgi:hypothetical protein
MPGIPPKTDPDPRLVAAAACSPEAAALLARDRSGAFPWARVVPALAALLVVAGLGWTATAVLRSRAPSGAAEARSEPAQAVDDSKLLAPLAMQAEGDELTAPFSGFAVSIDSEPPGAVVTVAGTRRGEAPVLAGVECAAGKPVEIVAEVAGRAPVRRVTTCRPDTLVKLTLRLAR